MNLKGKSVMVTGGAGFVGSHVVDRLIKEDPSNIVVVDNYFLGNDANLEDAVKAYPNIKILNQDAKNFDEMKQIMAKEDIQVVYNLAVTPLPSSLTLPRWSYEENVSIVLTLLEIMREKGFETLIHFSSSEVYGTSLYAPMNEDHPLNGLTPYAVSKAACDNLILAYSRIFDIDAAIIRPFNNYGPRQNDKSYAGVIPITIKRIMSGEPPVIFGDGKQTRDYIYVTDTAEAAVSIYNHPETRNRIFNIATGKETTINKLVQLITKHLNYTDPIVYQDPRPADVRRHIASIFLAEEVIDFAPKVSLEEGIKNTVEWYKSSYQK